MVNVRKRGKGYQYYFEIAPVNRQKKTTSKKKNKKKNHKIINDLKNIF